MYNNSMHSGSKKGARSSLCFLLPVMLKRYATRHVCVGTAWSDERTYCLNAERILIQ